jgi:hypothetical protein
MIKLLFFLLIIPAISLAQKRVPRFENDTLYTTTGFKIYKGQVLTFGKGTGKDGNFRYLNIKANYARPSLTGNNFIVKKLSDFGISQLNNVYILIRTSFTFRDGSKGGGDMHVAIDSAIQSSELIVPDVDRFLTDPVISSTLENLPRFQNDTVFTTSGYKIFRGKVLQIGNSSGNKETFKHIVILTGNSNSSISNTSIIVKELHHFGVDKLNRASIEMLAAISFKDGSRGTVKLRIAFDDAIAASELIFPKE